LKNQFLAASISTIILTISLTACSSDAPRINPGSLEVSQSVTTHLAQITNIVQLSEKEASGGKMFLGGITGALIADALTDDKSDLAQDLAADFGRDIGEAVVRNKYGKTIYKLTLALKDGSVKHIHVRGGAYVVGRHVKITINKSSGNITSLIALKT
jgi:hypothetical protein